MKVPDTLRALIASNPNLEFGVAHNLFNQTQLARFLQPLVNARVHREVSVSAISMALSRLGPSLPKGARQKIERFKFKSLVIQPALVILTLAKANETHKEINQLHARVSKRGGHFCVCEGASQVTVIIDENDLPEAKNVFSTRSLVKPISASSISMAFDPKYLTTPGFLYIVLQQIALQGINILELSSTATELILYISPESVTLAFDTLYERFMKR
jgi:predicted peroxiredoxin